MQYSRFRLTRAEVGQVALNRHRWPRAQGRPDDEGAVAVIVALSAVLLLVLSAFVIDLGNVYATKARLQSAVDSAALAAAQYVATPGACPAPAANSARRTAIAYAAANGVAVICTDVTVDATTSSVSVEAAENVPFFFGNIVRVAGATPRARAVAKLTTAAGGGYGIFSAGLWTVNGGGTGLSVAGGGGYAGTLNFNGNANNKTITGTGGLQSPDSGTTTKWNDGTTDHTHANAVPNQGTALSYATSIGLDGPGGFISTFGTPPSSTWYQVSAGDCTINQAVFTARYAYPALYCGGRATVSGMPAGVTRLIRAASIHIDRDVNWNGTCAPPVLLYATSGGASNSGTNNTLCGSVYAPNGEFSTNGGGLTVYQGRIVAASVTLGGNGGAFVSTVGDTLASASKVTLTQ